MPCPFPDPDSLDNDALASVNVTLASFVADSRRVFDDHPNPVTEWLWLRDELASDYVAGLVAYRFGQALDAGELGDDNA
jgi:hypothetical protein